jgi:hypothetical protein
LVDRPRFVHEALAEPYEHLAVETDDQPRGANEQPFNPLYSQTSQTSSDYDDVPIHWSAGSVPEPF